MRPVPILLLGATNFAAMALLTKALAGRLPTAEVTLTRFAVGLVAVGIAALWGVPLRPTRWGWLFARGLFGGLSVLAYFACIEHVPVGVATLLNYTSPVFTMLFSWWLLGEQPRPRVVAGLAATLVGTSLVIGIQALHFGGGLWEGVGVLSAIGSGIAVTSIRGARRPAALVDGPAPESTWSVFLSFNAMGLLVALPFVFLAPGGPRGPQDGNEVLLLALVGLTSVGAQLCLTSALGYVSGVVSGIVNELTIVLTMLGAAVWLSERPTPGQIVGTGLTIAGVIFTVAAATSRRSR